jgi:hypothetical protein
MHVQVPTEIKNEIVYNMYRVTPVVVFGSFQLCHIGNLKSRLDCEPPKFNLSKDPWGFYSPRGVRLA